MALKTTPVPGGPPIPPQPTFPYCKVKEQPDGAWEVTFLVTPDITQRLRHRIGTMDKARYLWENIIYRNLIPW